MLDHDLDAKLRRYRGALDRLVERLRDDRYVLAAVLVGGLSEITIWRKEAIGLWVIEADGVTKRMRADGNDERIFRTFVEDGVNIHAEIIPRGRFKRMVEGASRTAFRCNVFAGRELVYSEDPSITSWFDDANRIATRDRQQELLVTTTWVIHGQRHAAKLLHLKQDLELTALELLGTAWALAATEIVRHGEVYEDQVIYRGIELAPDLFRQVYLDVLGRPRTRPLLEAALERIDGYLEQHATEHLEPLLRFLDKQQRVVPLSEISDHFAFSQLYPWHLEAACEWLERKGKLTKVAAPFAITTRSRTEVEEPAYFLDG